MRHKGEHKGRRKGGHKGGCKGGHKGEHKGGHKGGHKGEHKHCKFKWVQMTQNFGLLYLQFKRPIFLARMHWLI